MNNKKKFNNLFDSIMMLLLTLFLIGIYVLFVFIIGMNNENINKILVYIIYSLIFIPAIITTIFMLLLGCFEWWKIDNEHVESKKILKKRIQIKIEEIVSINEEVVPALILGTYKTNAIVIKSVTKKIVIYLNKNNTSEYIRNLINNHN